MSECACVCVFSLPDVSPDKSGGFASIQHFIIKSFGLKQIRLLYRYVEGTNSPLINA